jgi:1-acyl-sn-glycerol-3-phosphate acyltransferase
LHAESIMIGALIYGFLYTSLHFCRLIGWFRWSIEGLERLPPREGGGMIIAMNHVDWMDIPVIGAMLPFKYRLSWVGKSELFKHPLGGWFFRQMQVIPINRGKRDTAALETSAQALRDGAVLLIFPEGTRSRSGVLRTGRGGAVRLAMQSGTPIVPIAVTGTEHGLRGTLTRRRVHLRVGRPFVVEPTPDGKIPPQMMEQLTETMMRRIAELLPPEQRGAYAELPAPAPSPATE